MAGIDFASLPEDRTDRINALFSIASDSLKEILQNGDLVVSVAIAGAKYAGCNVDSDDGDTVSSNLFETINRLAGDAQALGELRSAMKALRTELDGIA